MVSAQVDEGTCGLLRGATRLKCASLAIGIASLGVGYANALAAQCMQSANVFLAAAAFERDAVRGGEGGVCAEGARCGGHV